MSELRTARLRLRRWRDEDLDGYARICADPEVMRHLGGKPYTREESDRQMRGFMDHWDEHGFGLWAVDLLDGDRFIGFIGLSTHAWFPGVEVGWRLDRSYWGGGLATEGAAESISFGFEELGLDRIVSIHQPANVASRRVMEKNGLTFDLETVLPHNQLLVWVYAITRVQWETQRATD
ncbi:MAG: GNAT family N-acetyltransferase [Acidimicrobiia bacterium]